MIACERFGKRYGDRWLFRHLEFTVQRGECLVILGDNGSGKSTLLKALAGLAPLTEGSRTVEGPLGFAALDQAVYPQLTVREHLELAADLRAVPPQANELLEEVGLLYAAEQLAKTLSTGMRARLKLALAWQADPEVLLLDEPGAGLDEAGRDMLERCLQVRQEKLALILATNDPNERRFATHELRLGT